VIIALAIVSALGLAGVVYLAAGGGGLKIQELVPGTGASAQMGQSVSVLYTGSLENGTVFDSNLDRNQPLQFTLGAENIIRGLSQGVEGMKVGGKRRVTIPPELAYGKNGFGQRIPPDSTLIFEVELLDVK
jgi:FKBP-type peptidyl-prolyl cis-trans isomerase